MFTKIYLGLFAIAVLVMGVLTFLCYSWLQSIGDPMVVVQNYKNYAGISWTALWIAFVTLLVFANVLLWKDGRSWALWTSVLFFIAFLVVQTFWLEKLFFEFQKVNRFNESSYFLKPFLGVTIGAMSAVGVLFTQCIAVRMRNKIYGNNVQEEPAQAESPEEPEESE